MRGFADTFVVHGDSHGGYATSNRANNAIYPNRNDLRTVTAVLEGHASGERFAVVLENIPIERIVIHRHSDLRDDGPALLIYHAGGNIQSFIIYLVRFDGDNLKDGCQCSADLDIVLQLDVGIGA